jgi:hypothetical protein
VARAEAALVLALGRLITLTRRAAEEGTSDNAT